MIRKMAAFIVLAFLTVPFASLAQSPSSPAKSIESLSAMDISEDSIVILSQEETGVPGYVHQKYAYNCGGEFKLVDYYGSAFDPKDQSVLRFERQMCSRQQNNDYDSSND
jgi:hypothetical protein